MPLTLNCGLTKKIGEPNFSSRGAAIHVELELESTLINDPAKLQERIRQAFAIVRASLDEELNGNGHAASGQNGNGQHKVPANTNGNGASQNSGQRQATQSQVKAIHAIAKRRQTDLARFLNDRFHVGRPDDLTLKDASRAIDLLKADGTDGRAA
jgi:hypothetical protein